jgi:hypothetical protein
MYKKINNEINLEQISIILKETTRHSTRFFNEYETTWEASILLYIVLILHTE